MSKLKRISWMQTRIICGDEILLIFVNEIYNFPGVLHIGKKEYEKIHILDFVKKKGILREIYVKAV